IQGHGGHVFKTMGDQFCAVFADALAAVRAAAAAQRALRDAAQPLKVRIALHTGPATQQDGDYFGPPLNRVARLLGAGHGGQVLLSQAIVAALPPSLPEKMTLHPLGAHRLRDLAERETIYQL